MLNFITIHLTTVGYKILKITRLVFGTLCIMVLVSCHFILSTAVSSPIYCSICQAQN